MLDTNVIISGMLWKGNEDMILQMCDKGELQNFASPEIFIELESVLQYDKFRLTGQEIGELLQLYLGFTEIVIPKERYEVVSKDPSDNKFIDCAVAAEAEVIVSGDSHLLEQREFLNIRILKPTEFLKIIDSF
ncbi:MAG: putative toxin-antitoxin system toxin component, PIN family [Thermoplasmata archaeon]|nr:putative toxin-antitoxin system toxin component, PIN family [Thermoplasmata archaeon]